MKNVPELLKTLCCAKANSEDDLRFFGTDSQLPGKCRGDRGFNSTSFARSGRTDGHVISLMYDYIDFR